VTSPRGKPPRKSNIFLKIKIRRLAESVNGLNSSVAIVASELLLLNRLKTAPKFWRARDSNG